MPTTTLRCAFCHGPAGQATSCASCGTILHAACWTDAGRCPTLGCAGARPAQKEWVPHVRPPPRFGWVEPIASGIVSGVYGFALLSCCLVVVAMILSAVVAISGRLNAPRIDVVNHTGGTIYEVTVSANQFEGGSCYASSARLGSGESIRIAGRSEMDQLSLQRLSYSRGGVEQAIRPRSSFDFFAKPRQHAVFAIQPDGTLREVDPTD